MRAKFLFHIIVAMGLGFFSLGSVANADTLELTTTDRNSVLSLENLPSGWTDQKAEFIAQWKYNGNDISEEYLEYCQDEDRIKFIMDTSGNDPFTISTTFKASMFGTPQLGDSVALDFLLFTDASLVSVAIKKVGYGGDAFRFTESMVLTKIINGDIFYQINIPLVNELLYFQETPADYEVSFEFDSSDDIFGLFNFWNSYSGGNFSKSRFEFSGVKFGDGLFGRDPFATPTSPEPATLLILGLTALAFPVAKRRFCK